MTTARLKQCVMVLLMVAAVCCAQLPTLPGEPPPGGVDDALVCECQYDAGNDCECGEECSTEAPQGEIQDCEEDGLSCQIYCRSKGFDVCQPQNCECAGCPQGVSARRTAIDGPQCDMSCDDDGCNPEGIYTETVLSKCLGPGDASVEQDPGGPACFPAGAMLQLDSGKAKPVEKIEVGDRVAAGNFSGNLVFSDVFAFTHRKAGIEHRCVQLVAGPSTLVVSAGHYVHTASGLVAARAVRVGDLLLHSRRGWVAVTSTALVWTVGLYHPHTLAGDVVVDEFVVSTYSTAVHPAAAQLLLAPLRWLYTCGLTRNPLGSLLYAERPLLTLFALPGPTSL